MVTFKEHCTRSISMYVNIIVSVAVLEKENIHQT